MGVRNVKEDVDVKIADVNGILPYSMRPTKFDNAPADARAE
jgi:hypothetical protein